MASNAKQNMPAVQCASMSCMAGFLERDDRIRSHCSIPADFMTLETFFVYRFQYLVKIHYQLLFVAMPALRLLHENSNV